MDISDLVKSINEDMWNIEMEVSYLQTYQKDGHLINVDYIVKLENRHKFLDDMLVYIHDKVTQGTN